VATLPLFDPLALADAAHRVRAPGGYELWRFIVRDSTGDTWVIATFQLGFACRAYIRRYFAFRRRPTRRAPPLPSEYPAVTIWICANGRVTASTARFDPTDFFADGNRIRIGAHEFTRQANGAIHLQTNCLDMRLHPRFACAPVQHALSGSAEAGSTHQWLLGDGVCQVNGTIRLDAGSAALVGTGIHDQQFGSTPMLAHCLRGYFFFADRAISFQQFDQMHIARIAPGSITVQTDPIAAALRSRTPWGIAYPRVIALSGGAVLENPRVVHSTPTLGLILYQATLGSERGTALCEIGAAHRMAWPARWWGGNA
jgi:hypothetical protein